MTLTDIPKPPPPLPQQIRLLTALAGLCSTLHPYSPPSPSAQKLHASQAQPWLQSVCKILEIDSSRLPPSIEVSMVQRSAQDQVDEWTADEKLRVAGVLVEASLAAGKKAEDKDEALRYTPLARALSYRTLDLLGLSAKALLPEAEKNLAHTLFVALKAAQENSAAEKVESARAAHSQGWGGTLGRHLATGAGVIAGGVLIGVTGGLAAPAIATLLAPSGIGSLISAGAAPVVFGTLFGVGGGGLAGRRVRERWKGVEEFGFVEVGNGVKATKEEVDDLSEAKKRLGVKKEETGQTKHTDEVKGEAQADESAEKEVEEGRMELEDKLLKLSIEAGTRTSISAESTEKTPASPRVSLDHGKEERTLEETKKPPSLTATVVVPGLLTVSQTEAITAWRAICSANTQTDGVIAPGYEAREKGASDNKEVTTTKETQSPSQAQALGLKDGRDVYLLRFETAAMLKTGRDIDHWVGTKLKGKIKGQIIKRTVLSAYFAAVSLPMSIYSMATMSLDNTWMHAQDRAVKAGRLLGEVLEKRVQGERPVVLIGSSLGALTVLQALLYLSTLSTPSGYVESAYLVSLPSAPTPQEWAKVRGVVSRRVVNAYSDADFVLAGVVRLHEVVSRAVSLENGVRVAGLGTVEQPGVEDVDVGSVLRGHMEIQAKMGEIIKIIEVDK